MDRVKSWFDHQWATCPEEVKTSYGEEYFKHYLPTIKAAAGTAHRSVEPVVRDMVKALTEAQPRYRYVTAGSNSWYDWEKVKINHNHSSCVLAKHNYRVLVRVFVCIRMS